MGASEIRNAMSPPSWSMKLTRSPAPPPPARPRDVMDGVVLRVISLTLGAGDVMLAMGAASTRTQESKGKKLGERNADLVTGG